MNKKQLMKKHEKLEKSYEELNDRFKALYTFIKDSNILPRFTVKVVKRPYYSCCSPLCKNDIKVSILHDDCIITKSFTIPDNGFFEINGDYIEIYELGICNKLVHVLKVEKSDVSTIDVDLYLKAFPDRKKKEETEDINDGGEPCPTLENN